ncbi:MAG TPA: LSm family protein [archaeon]|nr:LSm family protein [archaeon]
MPMETPLDVASKSIGKNVLVVLRDSQTSFRGTMKTIDMHLNTVLENTEELQDGQAKRQLGRCIIRGDKVLFISL